MTPAVRVWWGSALVLLGGLALGLLDGRPDAQLGVALAIVGGSILMVDGLAAIDARGGR